MGIMTSINDEEFWDGGLKKSEILSDSYLELLWGLNKPAYRGEAWPKYDEDEVDIWFLAIYRV